MRSTKNKAKTNLQRKGELTAEEINNAESIWIKHTKNKHYITNGKLIEKQKQNQLDPLIHADGVIRLNGRFTNSNLHLQTALRKCVTCIRFQKGSYEVRPISPWPKSISSLYKHRYRLFWTTLHKKGRKKVWICLFTCTAVRVVHLKVVEDMSAEHFLEALCRFIARRGKPDEVISETQHNSKQQRTKSTPFGEISSMTHKFNVILQEMNQLEIYHRTFALDGRVLRKTCWNDQNGIKERSHKPSSPK